MNLGSGIASVWLNLPEYLLFEGELISCTRKPENSARYRGEFVKSKVQLVVCFSV